MRSKARRKRGGPPLVQISFKVTPEVAHQLDLWAESADASRHCIARLLVDEALSRSAVLPALGNGAPQSCGVGKVEEKVAVLVERLTELLDLYEGLNERFDVQEGCLREAQQDVTNGVFAVLVQCGLSQEQAEAFVRSHLHSPPRSE